MLKLSTDGSSLGWWVWSLDRFLKGDQSLVFIGKEVSEEKIFIDFYPYVKTMSGDVGSFGWGQDHWIELGKGTI